MGAAEYVQDPGKLALTLTFDGHRVRMAGTAEAPLWIAKDVCFVLGLHGASHIARDVPDAEKGVAQLATPGGPQPYVCVKEAGLYRLIARSRKASAQRFQAWLFGEVLPSIRRHGVYPPPVLRAAGPTDALSVFEAAVAALREQAERTARLEASVARIEARHQVAQQELRALPASSDPAPEKGVRALINERVRAWGAANSGAYAEAWRKLKHELLYRCHFDAAARAVHSGRNWLDEVEAANLMATLYAIACEVLPERSAA